MTVYTFQRPTAEPLHRETWRRPSSGAGADDFRVTQQFDDLDYYWSKVDPAKAAQKHRATDIGQGGCDGVLVAMAAGRVTHHVDDATRYGAPNNAICSRLDVGPGSGIVIDYWHCSRHAVANGTLVKAGQPTAYVGKTGLGQVCHCHITFRVNGVLIDPELLLFGGSLTIGGATTVRQEDPAMANFGGAALKAIDGAPTFRLTADSWFRSAPERDAATQVAVLKASAILYAANTVDGDAVGTNDQWLEVRAYVNSAYRLGYVHTSVAERVKPDAPATPVTDCTAAVAEAVAPLKERITASIKALQG